MKASHSADKEWSGYGMRWPKTRARIEAIGYCVRQGGQFVNDGKTVGAPLFDLYREMQTKLWGDRCEHNEWTDLMLKTILENRITTIIGSRDCGKTHCMSRFALTDYFCFPEDTLILMSSTGVRGLELRGWGEIKDLFNLAKEVWPEAPGFPVDSMGGIFTDDIADDQKVRDIRRGLICIPIDDSEGQWKGMSRWVGVKQKRRRVLSDERSEEHTSELQ